MIRILIADDHVMVREGLKRIVEEGGDIELVGEAGTGRDALRLARELLPDIVVLDISMPERSGLDVLLDIRRVHPEVRILILSMHPEEQYAIRCLRQGADGYMTKESAPELLLQAIYRLHANGKYISPALAERLAVSLDPDNGEAPHERLSRRELEVLSLIGQGMTVSQIADALCINVKTVSTYRGRILEKLDLDNNAQLMRFAIDHEIS